MSGARDLGQIEADFYLIHGTRDVRVSVGSGRQMVGMTRDGAAEPLPFYVGEDSLVIEGDAVGGALDVMPMLIAVMNADDVGLFCSVDPESMAELFERVVRDLERGKA